MDLERIGTVALDWVPWALAVLGAYWGFNQHRRAVKAEKRDAEAHDAPPWGSAEHVSGDLFTIRNSSARDVIVTAIEADPVEKAGLLRHRIAFPYTVYAGDDLGVLVEERYTYGRPSLVIEWRFSDGGKLRKNRRILASMTP